MARDSTVKRSQMRERIAQLAARLMAEDGIQGFAWAKRKAASQIGAPDTHNLPSNSEIEQALRVFQALYQKDEHPALLKRLRREALSVMRLLARFNPYLTGSVLTGTAGRHSDVNLHLYTDSPKDVEFFLINRQIPYASGEKKLAPGDNRRAVPTFALHADGIVVNVAVYSANDLRTALKNPADGVSPGRASVEAVEQLLREN